MDIVLQCVAVSCSVLQLKEYGHSMARRSSSSPRNGILLLRCDAPRLGTRTAIATSHKYIHKYKYDARMDIDTRWRVAVAPRLQTAYCCCDIGHGCDGGLLITESPKIRHYRYLIWVLPHWTHILIYTNMVHERI